MTKVLLWFIFVHDFESYPSDRELSYDFSWTLVMLILKALWRTHSKHCVSWELITFPRLLLKRKSINCKDGDSCPLTQMSLALEYAAAGFIWIYNICTNDQSPPLIVQDPYAIFHNFFSRVHATLKIHLVIRSVGPSVLQTVGNTVFFFVILSHYNSI